MYGNIIILLGGVCLEIKGGLNVSVQWEILEGKIENFVNLATTYVISSVLS